MDKKDKIKLNNRIITSVHTYRRKKRIQNISIAASLVLMIGVGLTALFFNNRVAVGVTSIQQHAKSSEVDLSSMSDVKLVLGNDEEVRIDENGAEILYSNTGETVNINNGKSVKQASGNSNTPIYNTIMVPYGKQSKISLSDGSKVWLNSGTKLTYPIVFTTKKREVYLEGEAIFEVAHNEKTPFYVVTGDYEVKVLGTVFNVSSYPDDDYTHTALESGSIEIALPSNYSTENKSIKIAPGTLATFSKKGNRLHTERVDISRYMSWRNGVFVFENDNLNSILKKVSRHYKVPILIENQNLGIQTFSGTLDISDDLEKVLKILKETTEFQYEILNNQVEIKKTK